MNLIKIIKESSCEHLNTLKISSLFNKTLKSYGSFLLATFLMKSITYVFISNSLYQEPISLQAQMLSTF